MPASSDVEGGGRVPVGLRVRRLTRRRMVIVGILAAVMEKPLAEAIVPQLYTYLSLPMVLTIASQGDNQNDDQHQPANAPAAGIPGPGRNPRVGLLFPLPWRTLAGCASLPGGRKVQRRSAPG